MNTNSMTTSTTYRFGMGTVYSTSGSGNANYWSVGTDLIVVDDSHRLATVSGGNAREREVCSGYYDYNVNNMYTFCSNAANTCVFVLDSPSISTTHLPRYFTAHTARYSIA
jgi:hypothetical protein